MSGPSTADLYEIVAKLVDEVDEMNDWEYDFVNNVAEYEEKGWLFSDAQKEKILQIEREYL